MGAQEKRLGHLLRTLGYTEDDKPPRPKLATMPAEAQEQVIEVYRALGGIHPGPPLITGPWDSTYLGNLVVELDESAHFNRYRATTLEPEWAQRLPWKIAYITYAAEFEEACTKGRTHGGIGRVLRLSDSSDRQDRMVNLMEPARHVGSSARSTTPCVISLRFTAAFGWSGCLSTTTLVASRSEPPSIVGHRRTRMPLRR